MTTDLNALEQEGWLRRFTASEPRLGEAVQTYRELGLEVLLIPILELCTPKDKTCGDELASCICCFEADDDPSRYKVIFTRPTTDSGGGDGDDELV